MAAASVNLFHASAGVRESWEAVIKINKSGSRELSVNVTLREFAWQAAAGDILLKLRLTQCKALFFILRTVY